MALDPSTVDLPVLAALSGAAVTQYVLERTREAGHPQIRTSHGYIFQRLIDDSPTVGELAKSLAITQQAASKAAAELERFGYIDRQPDAGDSRQRRLTLTDRGRSAIEAGRAARRELERRLEASPAQVADAKHALIALLDAAGGLDPVRSRRVPLPSEA